MKKSVFGTALFTARGLCVEHLFDVQSCIQEPSAGLPAATSAPTASSTTTGHSSSLFPPPSGTTSVQQWVTATVVDTLPFTVTTTRAIDPPIAATDRPSPTHVVEVNANGVDLFQTHWVDAFAGDVVRFDLRGRKLAIVQSTRQNPCRPNGRFDSRSQGHSDRDVYVDYTVEGITPVYFYAILADEPQGCHAGLRFTINPGDDIQRSHQAGPETHKETKISWNATAARGEDSVDDAAAGADAGRS